MIAVPIVSLISALLLSQSDSARRPPAVAPDTESDYRAVLEIGGAAEIPTKGATPRGGATIAVETTPIEHWLELESGVTELWKGPTRELSVDFLFKKPWDWSRSVEFMAGVGPEVAWASGGGDHGTSVSTEVIADLMFWGSRNVGFYLEPGFSTTGFRSEQSFGISAGIIVGIR